MNKELIKAKILLLSYFYQPKNIKINKQKTLQLLITLHQLEQQMQQDTQYGNSVKTLLDVLEKAYETYTNQAAHLNSIMCNSNPILLSFKDYIRKELNLVDSEIHIAHTWGLETLKKENHTQYAMITAFLKTNSNIVTDSHLIIRVRKIITNIVRSYWKQQLYHLKNNSNKQHHFQYLNVIEISSNNHLHMHFYLYNPEIIQLIQTIENKINSELKKQNLQVDIHIKLRKIYPNDKNYSNIKHNMYNKMKGNPQQNQVVLFVLRKLFSTKRSVTHSKIPITKEMLKKEMKKRTKKQETISYMNLAKELLDKILINNKKWKKVKSIIIRLQKKQIKINCPIIESNNFIQRNLGFFLKPNKLFNYFVKKVNKSEFIIEDLKNTINTIENRIFEKESKKNFIDLFENIDLISGNFGKIEQNNLIINIFNHLSKINFDIRNLKSNLLQDTYEYLIRTFTTSFGKEKFYILSQVNQILAQRVALNKSKIDSIYNTIYGNNSFLIRTKNYTEIKYFYEQELNKAIYDKFHNVSFSNKWKDKEDIVKKESLKENTPYDNIILFRNLKI